jgi:hypothetical protein
VVKRAQGGPLDIGSLSAEFPFRTDLDLHREWLSRFGGDPRRVAEKVWRAVCAADPPALITVGSGVPAVVVAARLAPDRLVEHLLCRHFRVSA